jgi:hypothetical protein
MGYTCDVCRHTFENEHDVVMAVSSVVQEVYNYCRDCTRKSYEPYPALLAGLTGKQSAAEVDQWVYDFVIKPSLKMHGKTEEQFWKEVNAGEAGTHPAHG